MKLINVKWVLGVVAGMSLFMAAGTASAADCTVLLPAFQDACNLNDDLASGTGTGAYIGSCAMDGGKCDDSVYNKLFSASSKVGALKIADACANLASIQRDLLTWSTAAKPKIDQTGYNSLSADIAAIQTKLNCAQ